MPIRSAITMAGIGRSPPRSRAAAEALIATRDDSNKPGKDGRMSARLRATHVSENVNVGSSCTAQTRQPRPGYGPRAGPGLMDLLLLTRVHRLRSLEAWVAPAVPARGRQFSGDRAQTVRAGIDEMQWKAFRCSDPPVVKKC